jgi:A/G-specific adenine glycosylase
MADMLNQGELRKAHHQVFDWYQREGRDLPWRYTRDGYSILVAEVMLQQTQVNRVLPKYREFLEHYSTFESLAEASRSDVIRIWSTLGYNRRAVRLHDAARQVVNHWNGQLPHSTEALERLPGIGRYTASAVACFAQGQDVVVIDTNIRRVLGRVFYGIPRASMQQTEEMASMILPREQALVWNQALMDIGATICRISAPLCGSCPLHFWCEFSRLYSEGHTTVESEIIKNINSPQPFKESRRYYRGRVIEYLRGLHAGESVDIDELGHLIKPDFALSDTGWFQKLINDLEVDGLVKLDSLERMGAQISILVSLAD